MRDSWTKICHQLQQWSSPSGWRLEIIFEDKLAAVAVRMNLLLVELGVICPSVAGKPRVARRVDRVGVEEAFSGVDINSRGEAIVRLPS